MPPSPFDPCCPLNFPKNPCCPLPVLPPKCPKYPCCPLPGAARAAVADKNPVTKTLIGTIYRGSAAYVRLTRNNEFLSLILYSLHDLRHPTSTWNLGSTSEQPTGRQFLLLCCCPTTPEWSKSRWNRSKSIENCLKPVFHNSRSQQKLTPCPPRPQKNLNDKYVFQ